MSAGNEKSKSDSENALEREAVSMLTEMITNCRNHGYSTKFSLFEVALMVGMSVARLRSIVYDGSFRITRQDFHNICVKYANHLHNEALRHEKLAVETRANYAAALRKIPGCSVCFVAAYSLSHAAALVGALISALGSSLGCTFM